MRKRTDTGGVRRYFYADEASPVTLTIDFYRGINPEVIWEDGSRTELFELNQPFEGVFFKRTICEDLETYCTATASSI